MEDIEGMALRAPDRRAPGRTVAGSAAETMAGAAAGTEPAERSGGLAPRRGMRAPPRAEDPVEMAVAQLRLAWCLADPFATADRWIAGAEWPFRAVALALEERRRAVAGRLMMLARVRLQAQANGLETVLALARRLPRGLAPTRGAGLGGLPEQGAPRLEDLMAVVGRAAQLDGYGWHGLPAGAMAAWSLGLGDGSLAATVGHPTADWLIGGAVPPEDGRSPYLMFGGVVDAAVLRALRACREGRMNEVLSVARLHSASLQDAPEQVECAAAALDAIDLRLQEIAWLLDRLQARLEPVALQARRVLDMQEARMECAAREARPGGPATGSGTAETAAELCLGERRALALLAALGGALYRTATVPVLDDAGRLTRLGGETVAAVRRWLMAQDGSPAAPDAP